MVYKWIENGAHIDIYCQTVHPESRDVVMEMAERPNLSLLDYSVVPDDKINPPRSGSLDKMKTFHFTLFDRPMQIWLEANHPVDSYVIYDCEWLPEELATADLRYDYLAEIVRRLRENSRQITVSPEHAKA